MTALLARWTEKLAGGPQAGTSDSPPPLARVMGVGSQQQQIHPVDPFHSLGNLKNQFTLVDFYSNSEVYNVWNGAVIEFPVVVSIKEFHRH